MIIQSAKIVIFSEVRVFISEIAVSLHPISGAVRLNRESGANPEQFPLL
jgi:hypothetical protein